MTVREIFNLRKQGKIEEAYEAIRPMYAAHKGRYTTLCMFWTASDVFKLRVQQKRFYEATKIFQALRRVLPNIDDKDGHAAGFMRFAGSQLGQLRRDRATVPAGPPVRSFGSPSLAPAASPGLVPAASPGASMLSGSSAAAVPAGSPAVSPAPAVAASNVLSDSVAEGLNAGQQSILDCIKAHEGIKVPKLSELTNIPSKSIERHVSALIARNLIEHRGSKKTGGYHVVTNE